MHELDIISEILVYIGIFLLVKITLYIIGFVIMYKKKKKLLNNIGDDLEFEDKVPDL